MSWEVQIAGSNTVLKELSQVLDHDVLRVEERGGDFFLTSSDFLGLKIPSDVSLEAQKILDQISGSARHVGAPNPKLKVAHVAKLRGDGRSVVTTQLVDKMQISVTEKLEIRSGDKIIHQSSTYDGVAQHLSVARSNLAVAKVLGLLRKEKDWVGLYRIYEIIEDDMKGIDKIVSRGWALKPKIKTFKHTANNPLVTGEHSRHGKASGAPPKNPMSFDEASQMIRSIIDAWIQDKT